jgi:ribosomal protein L11 methyltransferase
VTEPNATAEESALTSPTTAATTTAPAVEPRFPFLLVDTTPEDADVVSSELFDLGAQGVEERDATTLVKARRADRVTLVASFATREEAEEAKSAVDAALDPAIEEVVGDGWRDAWKEHFRPFLLCDGVVLRPPWEPYAPKAGERVLELEPGRAFGTGLHETTSLVARAIASTAVAGKRILDVGTGSGILALLALLLGAESAVAIDNDPDVLDVVRENAARNGLASKIDVSDRDVSVVTELFPLVVANIEARVLIPMAKDLGARVASKGTLVLSGILVPQKDEVLAAYPEFTLTSAPEKGDWVSLVLQKKA